MDEDGRTWTHMTSPSKVARASCLRTLPFDPSHLSGIKGCLKRRNCIPWSFLDLPSHGLDTTVALFVIEAFLF
jgi:hypothetical protein